MKVDYLEVEFLGRLLFRDEFSGWSIARNYLFTDVDGASSCLGVDSLGVYCLSRPILGLTLRSLEVDSLGV